MQKNKFGGLFIVFEGLDGSGSSTQAALLQKHLNSKYLAYQTKEPTNNIIGGIIRGALTHEWRPSPDTLQLLFAADRGHHLSREVIPNLKNGNIIISDRYFFSTIAFGSIDIDQNWLKSLNQKFLLPDLTFLIKVPPKECIKRIDATRNEKELFEQEEKLKKVWKTYSLLADEFAGVYTLDGTEPIEKIATKVIKIVEQKISKSFNIKKR